MYYMYYMYYIHVISTYMTVHTRTRAPASTCSADATLEQPATVRYYAQGDGLDSFPIETQESQGHAKAQRPLESQGPKGGPKEP